MSCFLVPLLDYTTDRSAVWRTHIHFEQQMTRSPACFQSTMLNLLQYHLCTHSCMNISVQMQGHTVHVTSYTCKWRQMHTRTSTRAKRSGWLAPVIMQLLHRERHNDRNMGDISNISQVFQMNSLPNKAITFFIINELLIIRSKFTEAPLMTEHVMDPTWIWKGNCVIHVTWLETCTTSTAKESELLGICLVGGSLNNWWRRLNIAARSIYPKHSRAVIYLKLSFPDRCFLLLLLGSCPSLIIASPGHLAFHYRHSGRNERQAQHVHDGATTHTRRDRQFIGTHRQTQTGFCVMLKATVALLRNKLTSTTGRRNSVTFHCIP